MSAKIFCMSMAALLGAALAAPAAEVRGVIVKMDQKKHELVIEGRGRGVRGSDLVFMVDKETEILHGKAPAKLADLTRGKRVRVMYETQAGERVAVRVTILGGLAAELAKQAPDAPLPVAPNDPNTVSGVLRRLALTDREIVVVSANPAGGAEKETTIFVPESAKVTRDQKTVKLGDLKEGDQVAVQVEKDGKETVAKSIQVGAPAPNRPMPSPRPPGEGLEKARRILKIIQSYLDSMDRP